MKRKLNFKGNLLSLSLLLVVITFATSCKKDPVITTSNDPKSLLTAHTWRVEKVVSVENNNELVVNKYGNNLTHNIPAGKTSVIMDEKQDTVILYKRGAANNENDFSKVRQTYKTDGSITYVDEDGNAGSNGHYELLDSRKIKIEIPGLSATFDDLVITSSTFSYTSKVTGGYIMFIFSPVN